jgi:hypothetical protein
VLLWQAPVVVSSAGMQNQRLRRQCTPTLERPIPYQEIGQESTPCKFWCIVFGGAMNAPIAEVEAVLDVVDREFFGVGKNEEEAARFLLQLDVGLSESTGEEAEHVLAEGAFAKVQAATTLL